MTGVDPHQVLDQFRLEFRDAIARAGGFLQRGTMKYSRRPLNGVQRLRRMVGYTKCMGILMAGDSMAVLTREGRDAPIAVLDIAGYRVCGSIMRDQTIVAGDISGTDEVSEGRTVKGSPDGRSGRLSSAFSAGVASVLQCAPVGRRTGVQIETSKSDYLQPEMEQRYGW